MDEGYYLIYSASSATNTINNGEGLVRGYKWATLLTSSRPDGFHLLDGTIQLVSESLSGSNNWVNYHGSNIIHIGRGVNDISEVVESDALFFAHLGQYGSTVQTVDDFYYWDRLFLAEGSSTWDYYQYHAHNPTSYAPFNNGRFALAADNRHGPTGIEEYAHMINVSVKSGATNYLSVMARIHTPSVGGAHNSHNDLELPSSTNKNYMMGGIINGSSDRFHAFYIAANGTQWDVFSRTYNYVNRVFNAEVNHGTYDLADPQLARTPGSSSLYPFRASAGKQISSQLYIPVVYNSGSSGRFDLKVWNFTSANNLPESPDVTTILTGSLVRPDCHLAVANNTLYAAVSNANQGGVNLYKLSGSNWVNEGQIVSNSSSVYLRVHGLDFNAEEFKLYTIISGQQLGTGSYSGSGVYSFNPDIPFLGYKHLDYVTGSNSFVVRNPLELGYVQFDTTLGTLKKVNTQEPQGVDELRPVLQYEENSPLFFDRRQTILSGNELFSYGIELQDGRQLFVGTKAEIDPTFDISYTNGIIAIFSPGDTSPPEYYEITGRFDDFITGVTQTEDGKVYIVGFTKDLLVPRRNLFTHGIGRGLVKSMTTTEKIEYVDMVLDATGAQYYVGNHIQSSSIILAKYDANFDLQWQRDISGGVLSDTAYGITRDSNGNLYIAGTTDNTGSGNQDALLIKTNMSGSVEWAKTYGNIGNQYASSIAKITKNATDYILIPIVSGSTTTIATVDLDGNVQEQNLYTNLIINRVRSNDTIADGKFTFAGKNNNNPTTASFGVGTIITGSMFDWISTHSSGSVNTEAMDMRIVGTNPEEYVVVGTEGTNGFVTKITTQDEITKSWSTTTSGSYWKALSSAPITSPTSSRNVFVVGYASASGDINQGGGDGVIAGFDYTGSVLFTNTVGHTGAESFNAIERDITSFNHIAAGWSESHTDGRRGLLFRFARSGFGTGNHHLEGAPGMALWYSSASALPSSVGAGTFNTSSLPQNTIGTLQVTDAPIYTSTTESYMNEIYEGSQIFDAFFGVIDLNDLQEYKNSNSFIQGQLNPINNFVTWTQIGVAGDGESDDGNIFAYDIITLKSGSNNGILGIAAQTSGDVVAYNVGNTGVYDYMVAFFDPSNPLSDSGFLINQVGTEFDEEIYSMTELTNGKVAFVGRTAGNLGGEPVGGYDIFLGITDVRNLNSSSFTGAIRAAFDTDYYTTGSGLADRGFNVHDINNIIPNTLAIVFETSGDLGGSNQGASDIGIILFNYETDTWGNAYQLGTTQNESLDTLGKVSTYIPDGRIVVVGSTTGIFADDGNSFGSSDIFVAIFNLNTFTWKKYQIGTGAADFGNGVSLASNGKLIIAGSTAATFISPNDAISVSFNTSQGIKGKLI
jgi:hypothetical protein